MAWIIERLDRKLADAIGSNIVEKCDVTLSRAIQPFWASYFSSHISLSPSFDYTYWPCLEVKGEEDLLLEKTESTKPVEAKDRVKKVNNP